MSDTIVRLNVGGRLFETTEHTLRFDGIDNFFTGLLSDRTPTLKDTTGAYFIDRDPDYFTVLLRFLRTRRLDEGACSLGALREEARFYSLDAVVDAVEQRINVPDLQPGQGPRLDGAYINATNTQAIVFTCNGESDEHEKRIVLVQDSLPGAVEGDIDAFSQARVARAAVSMPSLWDEMNKVDYAAFFYKYIKRGKFMVRHEPGGTFLSLIVPGGEQLTQNKMAVLTSLANELLVFTKEGTFAKFMFKSFDKPATF